MKKLALLLLISSSAHAELTGSVYARPVNNIGFVKQQVELRCNFGGAVKNNGTTEIKTNIMYKICDYFGKCEDRSFNWKIKPEQEWIHSDNKQLYRTYKNPGHYPFTCETWVKDVGQIKETGQLTIG